MVRRRFFLVRSRLMHSDEQSIRKLKGRGPRGTNSTRMGENKKNKSVRLKRAAPTGN